MFFHGLFTLSRSHVFTSSLFVLRSLFQCCVFPPSDACTASLFHLPTYNDHLPHLPHVSCQVPPPVPWGGRVAAAPRVGGKRDAVCNSPNAADAGRRAARRGTDVEYTIFMQWGNSSMQGGGDNTQCVHYATNYTTHKIYHPAHNIHNMVQTLNGNALYTLCNK